MRNLTTIIGVILATVLTGPSVAAETTWMLVPIHAQEVPGAFGSLWSTELRVFNAGDTTAKLWPPCHCCVCLVFDVPPQAEAQVDSWGRGHLFLSVDSEELPYLTFQLRVFDESRSMLNWGTTVPVVEWEKARAERFWFVRVPAATPFRHTLRVYSWSRESLAAVRYYDADTSELLAERTLHSRTDFGQLHSFDIPEIRGVSDVRIEVVSETGDDIWAMVSVTNDDTQVVTILPGEHRGGD